METSEASSVESVQPAQPVYRIKWRMRCRNSRFALSVFLPFVITLIFLLGYGDKELNEDKYQLADFTTVSNGGNIVVEHIFNVCTLLAIAVFAFTSECSEDRKCKYFTVLLILLQFGAVFFMVYAFAVNCKYAINSPCFDTVTPLYGLTLLQFLIYFMICVGIAMYLFYTLFQKLYKCKKNKINDVNMEKINNTTSVSDETTNVPV
ncbi:MAG: hypothetical protein Edafosvirus3_27 [Edafosvirus sp.]|uniref:Uncharacterized protein n=1 Tax=Edafosvirus sp. TaxID=2487765 RepID=A0A3G4ZWZ9_9VIRU|nr:MAG: hypothetical protein Edafosvirus3_27 [Edafosvirus sp.]